MKIAHSLFRRLAASSRPAAAVQTTLSPFRGAMGSAASSAASAFFCSGTPVDMPLSAISNHPSAGSRSFSSKSNLLEILSREEQEEIETGNTEMPPELSDLKATIEKSWKIVEDGATTNFFRIESSSSNKIQVSFHCQDTLEVEEPEYDDSMEEDSDEEEDEASAPVRFTVTVTKAGKSLNFACFSEYGQVKVEGVSTTSYSTAEYVHENQGTLPKHEYQGPDFTELAEDLQEGLAEYLDEECGVDSDMAAFIAMFADYREELQYVDFLKQAQSIVS
ncbi:unnamed protein product [Pseudo-nitzschia multistriata]|uniref:Mitochondrial glycoprotein domain-containing protein n=1 Tax=Pseudo-nitzschia multistriata TaxID=183589 RepID=A0A448YU61_9STRA|nr:unnamed protein product [Pseudo-nitzschia multistriata]